MSTRYGNSLHKATLIPLGPWPAPLEAARRVEGAVAIEEAGESGAWVVATAIARSLPGTDVVVIVDAGAYPLGLLALMVATLDAISGGCLVLAIRGPSSMEALSVLDRLLRGEVVSDHGLDGCAIGLAPVRKPRLPLLLPDGDSWRDGDERWLIRPLE